MTISIKVWASLKKAFGDFNQDSGLSFDDCKKGVVYSTPDNNVWIDSGYFPPFGPNKHRSVLVYVGKLDKGVSLSKVLG